MKNTHLVYFLEARTHTRAHTHARTQKAHTHMHTHTHSHTHARTHSHTHARTHMHTHTHTHRKQLERGKEHAFWKERHWILCFVDHQHKPHVTPKNSTQFFRVFQIRSARSKTERITERAGLGEMKTKSKQARKNKITFWTTANDLFKSIYTLHLHYFRLVRYFYLTYPKLFIVEYVT